ncbi:hypothetical protein RQP46_010448 [Phenoliferia psychrophenolica]
MQPFAMRGPPRDLHPFEVPDSVVGHLLDHHRWGLTDFQDTTIEKDGPPPSQGTSEDQYQEVQEHHFKKEAWAAVKSASKAAGSELLLACYRGTLAAPNTDVYGLLLSNQALSHFVFIDYLPKSGLDIPAHERLFVERAHRVFGLLLYFGNPDPISFAATWLAPHLGPPYETLPPTFVSSLPTSRPPTSPLPAPTARSLFLTPATYAGNLTFDDLYRIQDCLHTRMRLSAPGAGCAGPQYCGLVCQKKRWGGKSGHKGVCKKV